ncbi:carbonic anhydrase family protein [Flammeovirga sp. SubArs3]|uniref:carbonic anhydrase n=1 Tax=Flammeovirga sp. SubArs3 TaxID=2995316 RepID=UPI00248D2FE8|nr:carbonic anhydrase family protein [Flammeovirga sp. SubArs3]
MKTYFIIIIAFTSLFSCQNIEKSQLTTKEKKWAYEGETGPKHWAKLEEESNCDGLHQSPINIIDVNTISSNVLDDVKEMDFEGETTITSITNNGHTIQYNFNGERNKLNFNDKVYKMKQFHFHSPSEHTINGVRYPLEIHVVHHCEETDSYIVFAILVQQGEPDPSFIFLERHLPVGIGITKRIDESYDLGATISDIFGMDSIGVYTYQGSLTTPPCTQDVQWVVLKNASTASERQIKLLETLMPKNNYRDTQPINGRAIYHETITELF